MPSLLESITALVTPEMVEKLSKILGGKSDLIAKGLQFLGPLLLTALGKRAASPDGAGAVSCLLGLLPDNAAGDTDGLLSNVISSDLGEQLVGGLLGGQASAVTNSLARSSGVPGLGNLLQLAAPLGLAQIAEKAKDDNLDAAALVAGLQAELAGLEKSGDENAQSVLNAFKDADAQDEIKAKLGEEAWAAVATAPLLAASYVSQAGKPSSFGDPLGMLKELEALSGAFDPATVPAGSVLVDGVVSSIQEAFSKAGLGERLWDLGDVDLDDRKQVKSAVTDKLKVAVDALAALPAGEQDAYKQLIVDAATKVAEAGKEGGFLGWGSKQVSDDEAHALWNVKTALGL
jgi:hypothetical protein